MEHTQEQRELLGILDGIAKSYEINLSSAQKNLDNPDCGWYKPRFEADIAKLRAFIAKPPRVIQPSVGTETKVQCAQCARESRRYGRKKSLLEKQASYLSLTELTLASLGRSHRNKPDELEKNNKQ